jgi:hypothetical protein
MYEILFDHLILVCNPDQTRDMGVEVQKEKLLVSYIKS